MMAACRAKMAEHIPNTAYIALPLLLLSTCLHLLLCHGHFLLHVGELLLGSTTVLLKEPCTQSNIFKH